MKLEEVESLLMDENFLAMLRGAAFGFWNRLGFTDDHCHPTMLAQKDEWRQLCVVADRLLARRNALNAECAKGGLKLKAKIGPTRQSCVYAATCQSTRECVTCDAYERKPRSLSSECRGASATRDIVQRIDGLPWLRRIAIIDEALGARERKGARSGWDRALTGMATVFEGVAKRTLEMPEDFKAIPGAEPEPAGAREPLTPQGRRGQGGGQDGEEKAAER